MSETAEARLRALSALWNERARIDDARHYNRTAWAAVALQLRQCADELDAVLSALASAPADVDNHHNALTCPYCNPDGLVLSAPRAEPEKERP